MLQNVVKDPTLKRCHYDSRDQLRRHLADFVAAHTFSRRLKLLRSLTPYEAICKAWTAEPERFWINPLHQMPALERHPIRLRRNLLRRDRLGIRLVGSG